MRLIDVDKTIADLLTVDPRYKTMINWCIPILEAQPTIEPERKKGKWIDHKWCSICGCGIPTEVWGDVLSEEDVHFCPNCGSDCRSEVNI